MIAALYVETGGVYYGLPDVDPWDEARDARLYDGPWPVVAHPPCARWSRWAAASHAYWNSPPPGEDGGVFAAALAAVERFGGVLEHPAYSRAFYTFGLPLPVTGEWTQSFDRSGASAFVDQGKYGLPFRKPTWLYAVGVDLPALLHRPSGLTKGANDVTSGVRAKTPEPFRDLLITMAASAAKVPA